MTNLSKTISSSTIPLPVNPISILGIQVHPVTVTQLHAYINKHIDAQQKALILHANVHGLNLAHSQPWLHTFLNSSNLVFCDGAGVIWGAKLLGQHIPERITYADWLWQLGEFAEKSSHTLYFLGAKPGIVQQAEKSLCERFPNLQIVGVHHGYFDKNIDSDENKTVVDAINKVKPNILITAFGMPLQEQWLMENWDQLDVNITLTGGAVFDYLSGNLKRAPKWMTDNDMEWLGRLLIEPKRLWRRYVIGNPVFFLRIFLQKLDSLFLNQK
jgi:N-acetylglucosaminyldiphosphoundecaprenol N-acetyl-beta-D-mannosaminyltransferase